MKIDGKHVSQEDGLADGRTDGVLGLAELWKMLWAGKWAVAVITLAFIIVGVLFAARFETTYTAEALIVLQEGVTPTVAVDVFDSRRVVEELVDGLSLTKDPEFNPYLILAQDTKATDPRGAGPVASALRSFTGAIAEPLEDVVSALRPSLEEIGLRWPGEVPEPSAEAVRQATVMAVQESVVMVPVPDSNGIRVQVTAQSADKAATLANAMAEAFVLDRLETWMDTSDQVTERLSRRVGELRRAVTEAEATLQDFTAANEIIDKARISLLSSEAANLRERLERALDEAAAVEALERSAIALSQLQAAAARRELREDGALADLVASLGGLPAEPERTAAFVERLREAAAARAAREKRRVLALSESLASLDARLLRQNEQFVRLQQLEREVRASADIYEVSVRRLNELSTQSGMQDAGGRIAFEATPPLLPNGAGRWRTVAVLGFLGFMTGIGAILVREATDERIRSVVQLKASAPSRPVVSVPEVTRSLPFGRRSTQIRQLAVAEPTLFSEMIRRVRTTLFPRMPEDRAMVVAVFSALPHEGKTTMATALARSCALIGRKVLLIDADMRTRALGPYLKLARSVPGLQEALYKRLPLEDVVQQHETLGFDVVAAGAGAHNPADLLEGTHIDTLIASARELYDVIVIDTPAVLIAADAKLIAEHAQRCLFVVGWRRCRSQDLADMLAEVNVTDAGRSVFVLNRMKPRTFRAASLGRRGFRS